MTTTSRTLALLLGTLLTLSVAPASAQSDGEAAPEPVDISDAMATLADAVDPSDPDAPVDPGSPDAPVDPGSPASGDDVDPGDIDPSDPDSVPGDPAAPGPDELPLDPGEDEIEIEEILPSEGDEDGGFFELNLVPDPAPRTGKWRVFNKAGTVSCQRLGRLPLKKSTQVGRIRLQDDGRKLTGRSIFADQTAPVQMTWDPEGDRYRGKIRLTVPGGKVRMDFELKVQNPRRMTGKLTATTTVSSGGVSDTCEVRRGLTLQRLAQ